MDIFDRLGLGIALAQQALKVSRPRYMPQRLQHLSKVAPAAYQGVPALD
jgi:hypothetical protein